jgi:hypothetical protein
MYGEAARSETVAPWARLLDRHREAWAAQLLEGWSVVDLAAVEDPAQALAEAPERTAFVWLDGYGDAADHERLEAAIVAAGRRDVPLVIGFEAHGQSQADALAATLDDARIVTQELAAGSLIGAPADDESLARRRSAHVLVCANVGPDASSADLRAEAEPLMSGYVAWLEQANRELRRANARLGREHLGRHDAAAAAVEDRRADLEEQVAELSRLLEEQREATEANHRMLLEAKWDKESTLQAPRYRFVDWLRGLAFSLPGVSLLLKLRSRRVSKRWDPPAED